MDLPVEQVTVKAAVTVNMPKDAEAASDAPVAVAVVLDISGSTVNERLKAEGGEKTIINVEKEAALKLLGLMRPEDFFGLVAFSSEAEKVIGLTRCDAAGKEQAQDAVEGLFGNGYTNYDGALRAAREMLASAPEGVKRVIVFVSDGTPYGETGLDHYPDPSVGDPSLADEIRNEGTIIYTAAISNNLSAVDENRLKTIAGGKNFMAATTAAEVETYFKSALKKAQNAAVTNAKFVFEPIGLVQSVTRCYLLLKNGKSSFVRGEVKDRDATFARGEVDLGEVSPGDKLEVVVEFKTRLPKFQDGKTEQRNTFGAIKLIGACMPLGITVPEELLSEELYQWFAKDTTGATSKNVDRLFGVAEAEDAKDRISKTSNAAEQSEIIKNAQAKIRRATQIVGDDDEDGSLANALSDMDELNSPINQDAATRAKNAGRKTAIFVDDDDE
jgi:hypothetical protein